jgi:hypothetical protein
MRSPPKGSTAPKVLAALAIAGCKNIVIQSPAGAAGFCARPVGPGER